MSDKGPRFRFSEDFDLHLAREVYGQNPYEDPRRWGTIQINMLQITGRNVSIRTFRDRIQKLVKKYLAKSTDLKGKGYLVEKENNNMPENDYAYVDFNEGPEVASNIDIGSGGASSIIEETSLNTPQKNKTNMDKPSKKHVSQANILTRKRSAVNARQSTVQYLEKKNEKINEIRLKEVALQERKQLLEEDKWEMEKQERLKRLELEERRLKMDEKRLKIELDLFSNQQELIKMLFTKKDK
ncbi:unnamed protein product [Phaedon cochleariae]|uniref:Uncharacterized protein n=1 Tax=Phaedon cochleariae TaxID=80249 RepID=A0A9N9SI60_PHACE|nr:unnamed protein product [Phaedon cochleariae]